MCETYHMGSGCLVLAIKFNTAPLIVEVILLCMRNLPRNRYTFIFYVMYVLRLKKEKVVT